MKTRKEARSHCSEDSGVTVIVSGIVFDLCSCLFLNMKETLGRMLIKSFVE